MTPMKRYNKSIQDFKNTFLDAGFSELLLNSKKSKYNSYGGYYNDGEITKEIINDFSLILNHNYHSIGLIFNYKDDPVQIEATCFPRVPSKIHRNGEVDKKRAESSKPYSVTEFGENMRILNKKMKNLDDNSIDNLIGLINYRHQMLTHRGAVLRTNRFGWFPTGCAVCLAHCVS
jgi:hypothetical protein